MKFKLSNNIKENKIFKIGVIKSLLLILFFLNFFSIYAQTNQDSLVFLRVKYNDALAIHEGESINPNGITGPNYTNNNGLNSLLNSYNIVYYAPFYSKDVLNLELKNYYSIHLIANAQAFITELTNLGITNDIEILNPSKSYCNNPVIINDSWLVNNWANSDAINFINAKCAWTISKGDNNLRVAIADTDFEKTHEDLSDNIREVYGPITNQHPHGTQVLGVAGAVPNTLGIVGAGYNLKWDCSRVPHINLSGAAAGDPSVAIRNAANKGARVINVSWEDTHYDPVALQDLVDRGIVIVLGAGNDNQIQYHKDMGKIKGVILVSGVDKFGYHGTTNYQRNDEVDLCTIASGVQSTNVGNGYIMTWGSSFAAPQVSATAGLILSLNPCFTPEQVEYIIKSTTKPILDASSFPGLVGTGYLDMYAALKYAAGRSSASITTNEVWVNE
jgi:subtilisin family serine protease